MISIIACINNNNGIGKDGKLLYNIPADMKMFREITTGGIIICGRKTYESFPKKPLPNRFNIVITSKADKYPDVYHEMEDGSIITTIGDLKVFLVTSKKENNNIFIVGGGQLYKELLPYCEKLYITRVDDITMEADTFFPEIKKEDWYCSKCTEWITDEYGDTKIKKNPAYRFEEYLRLPIIMNK